MRDLRMFNSKSDWPPLNLNSRFVCAYLFLNYPRWFILFIFNFSDLGCWKWLIFQNVFLLVGYMVWQGVCIVWWAGASRVLTQMSKCTVGHLRSLRCDPWKNCIFVVVAKLSFWSFWLRFWEIRLISIKMVYETSIFQYNLNVFL